MDIQQFESLLFEEESTELDVKEGQYPFNSATDEEKSEILKDILAFVNGWRRADAFIIRGVKEIKGGRSLVTGVEYHLEDANLQQFVNSKTNQPVTFRYIPFEFEGKQVGILHIPLQNRPIYAMKNYGRVQENAVYLRRGSSTVIARPDEIARMGIASVSSPVAPDLKLQFANSRERSPLGPAVALTTRKTIVPETADIPSYSVGSYGIADLSSNRNYYREVAIFVRDFSEVQPLRFCITNNGESTATDVRLEAIIQQDADSVFLRNEPEMPEKPRRDSYFLHSHLSYVPHDWDTSISLVNGVSHLIVDFGKVQPKQTVYSNTKVYFGAHQDSVAELLGTLTADEVSNPVQQRLRISVVVEQGELTMDQLMDL